MNSIEFIKFTLYELIYKPLYNMVCWLWCKE